MRVDHFETEEDKKVALVHRVLWAQKPGIIYVSTRKKAEEMMAALAGEGVDALFYHGGLKAQEREDIQNRFMSGQAEVMVATNAFGMGVDKADVRFVYHYDVSESLDSYYQEIGRADAMARRPRRCCSSGRKTSEPSDTGPGKGRWIPRSSNG